MATQSEKLENTDDPFLRKTAIIRQELDTSFKEYHLSLDKRKQELETELDTAETEYKKNKLEHKQKLAAIEQIRSSIKQQTEAFKSMENSLLADVNKQILSLEHEYMDKDIELYLDTTFTEKIQTLGKLEMNILPKQVKSLVSKELPQKVNPIKLSAEQKICSEPITARDYSNITKPILSAVKQGDRDCDLKYPQRVAVDSKTGNIFIADQTSHCVKIFNQQGQYMGKVEHNNNINRGPNIYYIGKVELVHPYGVCLYQDSLYVTSLVENKSSFDLQPFIFKFDRWKTHFVFSKSCGVHGSNDSVFKRLTAISADPGNGDVYVCDEESKIHVLDKNLNYKRLLSSGNRNIVDLQVKEKFVYWISKSRHISVIEKYSGTCRRDFQHRTGCSNHRSEADADVMCLDLNSILIFNKNNNDMEIIEEIVENTGSNRRQSGRIFDNPTFFNTLKSFSLPNNPADDGGFNVRGITTDTTSHKIIIVLYSKDNMLQIY